MTTVVDAVRGSPLARELTPSEIDVLAGMVTHRDLKVMRAILRVSHAVQRRLSREVRDMENYICRAGAKA